jgi:lysophospholipid acyltransferase (LPLAT)-like uncharacterized protein
LVAAAKRVVPRLYVGYMWLVWKTSRVRDFGVNPHEVRAKHGGGVFALWHDEVFFVAYSFRRFRPHTLASRSDFGAVITRMLELCDFQVFRGGSSSGRKRRSAGVLREMIECMRSNEGVLFGITVDGSNGPAYRLKSGAILLAAACQKPLMVERTWCRRYVRLPTWDGTILPLPFNDIVHLYAGPYTPCARDASADVVEALRAEMENELLELTYYAQELLAEEDAGKVPANFPANWMPRWDHSVSDPDDLLRKKVGPNL